MKLSSSAILLIMAVACTARTRDSSWQYPYPRVHNCGKTLAQVMNIICRGQERTSEIDNIIPPYYGNLEVPLGWPLASGHKPKVVLKEKLSVVDECCDKTCSYEELLSYC